MVSLIVYILCCCFLNSGVPSFYLENEEFELRHKIENFEQEQMFIWLLYLGGDWVINRENHLIFVLCLL